MSLIGKDVAFIEEFRIEHFSPDGAADPERGVVLVKEGKGMLLSREEASSALIAAGYADAVEAVLSRTRPAVITNKQGEISIIDLAKPVPMQAGGSC